MSKGIMQKGLELLLEECGCRNIKELWDYIDYLRNVKSDYELLKEHVKYVYEEMQSFY